MNKTLKVVLSVAVVIAIAGAYLVSRNESNLGATPGPVQLSYQEFYGGVLYGRTLATSSAQTTQTLVATDIVGYDTILFTPNTGDITLTLPASTTLKSFLPLRGQRQQTCFHNASTTAGIDVIFAAGTGIDLETASSTATDLTILADQFACFQIIRKANTDFGVLLTEYTNGD